VSVADIDALYYACLQGARATLYPDERVVHRHQPACRLLWHELKQAGLTTD